MILNYQYHLTDKEAALIKSKLRLKCNVEVVDMTIDFTISPCVLATYYEPDEGNELDVMDNTINYIADEDGVPIILHHVDRAIVFDCLDVEKIDEVCYSEWNKYIEGKQYDNY